MPRLLSAYVVRWQDRAAVRAEHQLEPTLRTRFDGLPERMARRRALRADRRARRHDVAAIDAAIGRSWASNSRPHR